jgi:hypothetical protein
MKYKIKHPSNRVLILILVLIIALQTALLGYFGMKINGLWLTVNGYGSPQQQLNNSLASFPVKTYIRDANANLYKNEGVSDINGTKVYFPELRIYLPFTQLSRDLKYTEINQDMSDPVSIQTKALLGLPVLNINDVPCMQNFVGLTVNKSDTSSWQHMGNAGSVNLKDGRTLYLYKNNLKQCDSFWQAESPDSVITLLKQAQSY